LVPIPVVVRKREPAPERLTHRQVTAGFDSRREPVHGLGEVSEDEGRAQTEGGVVRLGLEARARPAAELEGDPLLEPGFGCTLDGDRVELGRDLDPVHVAPELLGEKQRRSAAPRGDVEDARVWTQAETSAEPQELLPGGRVLDLVRRLGDDEVARDHSGII
jgi:hypothetical protein